MSQEQLKLIGIVVIKERMTRAFKALGIPVPDCRILAIFDDSEDPDNILDLARETIKGMNAHKKVKFLGPADPSKMINSNDFDSAGSYMPAHLKPKEKPKIQDLLERIKGTNEKKF